MTSRLPLLARLAFLWLSIISTAPATTVRPPVLDDLVTLADSAVAGTVTGVRSEWQESEEGRFIHTLVTFRIDDLIIGDAASPTEIELDFLGGTIGERSMTVVGQPQFAIGDRELLFVTRNGQQLSPLVRMGYGRYRLVPDTENARSMRVLRENHQPLRSIGEITRPLEHHVTKAAKTAATAATVNTEQTTALTYTAFRQEITLRAQVHGRPVHAKQLP